ncbi:unnamed protein product [Cyprideis torosa]|uniref:tRNA/rRNA methyltransferase SpoU type domain-containing protein n=1 Tax=Cyprideis torosa TaxID=163714 RepID=A0A7R8X2Z8_9CRUS|nr:unnamed protein product [Cyprideis torosa]CAG0912080.1 unnamed protein product [Cyprideis torosa]
MAVDLIEPAGFRLDDKSLMRSGMDYVERANLTRHADWTAFETWRAEQNKRLVLLTTASKKPYTCYEFSPDDCIIFGRESAGAPQFIHEVADARLTIPMATEGRSLNLAISVGMVAGEAVRQASIRI